MAFVRVAMNPITLIDLLINAYIRQAGIQTGYGACKITLSPRKDPLNRGAQAHQSPNPAVRPYARQERL